LFAWDVVIILVQSRHDKLIGMLQQTYYQVVYKTTRVCMCARYVTDNWVIRMAACSQQDQEVTQGGPFVIQWNPSVADNILSLKGRCP